MSRLREYGRAPFTVAVVHGGPGAGGEMAPVARALAAEHGVLEPLQNARSLEGQVSELADTLALEGSGPCAVVGHSWGAWLGFIAAARHPDLVRKLILVGAGPFAEDRVPEIRERRMARLGPRERVEFDALERALSDPGNSGGDTALRRLGELAAKSDSVDPIPWETEREDRVEPRADVFRPVWAAAAEMRRSGKLLRLGALIRCPVVAIHGECDPHPSAGVRDVLAPVIEHFRFIELPECGHTPWLERRARERFYEALREELREAR